MKKLLLFLCLLAQIGFAETPRIDSLKRELRRLDSQPNRYPKDTLRCQTLKALMRTYSDENIDSSLHYNTLMIKLCDDPKLEHELSFAYQYGGYLYQVRGDYSQSIRFYYRALSLAEKLKQYSRIARSQAGLAHAYTSLKNYGRAINFCQQGLAILHKHPDANVQLPILNVLGAIYREQGKLQDALKVNQDMYKLAQRERKSWFESHGLHAIGWVYQEMGNLNKALYYYEKALTLCRKIGSVDLEGSILLHITDVYIQQKKWPKALIFCNMAKQTAVRVKNSGIVAEAYERLSEILSQTGESVKALKTYKEFVLLKDSLSKKEKLIEGLEAQYALQKERAERLGERNRSLQIEQMRNWLVMIIIAILLVVVSLSWNNRRLQAKNREIDRQRALLETARSQLADINKTLEIRVNERTEALLNANKELTQSNEKIKEALFKGQTIERKRVALELHDNLSSQLSAVNMSMQFINPQNLSESEQSIYRNVRQLIQNAYAEVRNISHNILPAELEREGLATTLTTLVSQLNQNLPLQFSLTITDLRERLPVGIEFNVYSIVRELINNAIKHAEATTIGISLFRTDSGIDLAVTDDGVGLGQNHDKRGVGLQNIQTRLESLGGTFNTVLPAEKGTRILIKIPIESISFNGNISII